MKIFRGSAEVVKGKSLTSAKQPDHIRLLPAPAGFGVRRVLAFISLSGFQTKRPGHRYDFSPILLTQIDELENVALDEHTAISLLDCHARAHRRTCQPVGNDTPRVESVKIRFDRNGKSFDFRGFC